MTDFRGELQASLGSAYSLERELGGGGMSRVWVATETALGRQVVVKVIAPELREGLSAERFTREVKLAARLQQANIVPVLSAGTAGGIPYYTMPFVTGESLRARLAAGAPLSLSERMSILRDVARALAYAHSQGIVHRDIKPDNVLLSHGTAVVTDFGIAKAIDASRTQDGAAAAALTQEGGSIGTPGYMAPEQAVGDAVDFRADLYAWGVMAYEMLSGAHPFGRHITPQALITAHLTEEVAPLAGKNPAVSAALAAIVMRCLEKNPSHRPASAAEVLGVLDNTGTPVPSGTIAVSRAPRRAPLVAAAAGVLVLAAAAWIFLQGSPPSTPAAVTEQSLAVLPFESVGGDTANAYLAEGIADELATALAKLPGLRVAGRSSAARFRGKGATANEVGTALQVGAVLEGTVRRSADRVRVTAQLSSASTGLVLWTDSYERELKEVFALQDDITRAIVSALSVRLASAPGRDSVAADTRDPEAYDLYLRGLYFFRRRGTALDRAEEYFAQAIARDSMFARAHALLALTLVTKPYYFPVHIGDLVPRARRAAGRAVALNDGLSEGHLALSLTAYHAFDWAVAESEITRAIALDPKSAEAHYRFGFVLFTMGRIPEAIVEFERSKTLDPLYSLPTAYLGWCLAIVGQGDAGIAEARRAIEIDSALVANQTILALTYLEANHPAEARATAERAMRLTDDSRRLGWMSLALAETGDTSTARAVRAKLLALPAGTAGRTAALAFASLGIGDTARALSYMEEAANGDGDLLLATAPISRLFDSVRESPRFAAVLRRFNLDVPRRSPAP